MTLYEHFLPLSSFLKQTAFQEQRYQLTRREIPLLIKNEIYYSNPVGVGFEVINTVLA